MFQAIVLPRCRLTSLRCSFTSRTDTVQQRSNHNWENVKYVNINHFFFLTDKTLILFKQSRNGPRKAPILLSGSWYQILYWEHCLRPPGSLWNPFNDTDYNVLRRNIWVANTSFWWFYVWCGFVHVGTSCWCSTSPADYRLRQPDKRLAKLDLKTHNVSTTSKHFHAG